MAGYEHGARDSLGPGPAAPLAPATELQRLYRLFVLALTVVALHEGREVFIRITLAIILSFVLAPLVNLLRRVGLWRGPAVIASVAAAVGAITLVGTLLGGQAAVLAADTPRYAVALQQKMTGVQSLVTGQIAVVTRAFGARLPGSAGRAETPGMTTHPDEAAGAPRQPLLVEIAPAATSALVVARTVLEPVVGPLETLVIVLVVAVFILLQREDLRDRIIRVFGAGDLHRTTLAIDEATHRLGRYFVSQLAVNAGFGVLIGAGLWAIGIPSPALWGAVAGLLRFVPYVGAMLAAVAPIALGAAVDPGWATAGYTALLFVIAEPLTGYVVEPLLYGHSTGLSPVSVIVSAVFWTWMWGPIGLILSTPLTLCLVVLGRHVKSLEVFDVLLGDRPALSPVERFYQRILADDPDEALDLAAAILTNGTLLDYYDRVVLAALTLAAEDEARGTITRGRALAMTRSMLDVINDLDAHVDAPVARRPSFADGATASAATGVVACIAGRGPFDDAVSAMVAQVLAQRGITAQRIPYAAVARDAAEPLDLAGAAAIVVSYLTLAGSPAHVRYLVKRLRQRAPHARIAVGLWPPGEAPDPAGGASGIGADTHAASLSDLVAFAMQAVAPEMTAPAAGPRRPTDESGTEQPAG